MESSASSFHPMKDFSWFGFGLLSSCVPQKKCPHGVTIGPPYMSISRWEKKKFLMNVLSF